MCVYIDIHRLKADDSVIAEGMGCVFAAVEVVVEEPIGQQHWDDWLTLWAYRRVEKDCPIGLQEFSK